MGSKNSVAADATVAPCEVSGFDGERHDVILSNLLLGCLDQVSRQLDVPLKGNLVVINDSYLRQAKLNWRRIFRQPLTVRGKIKVQDLFFHLIFPPAGRSFGDFVCTVGYEFPDQGYFGSGGLFSVTLDAAAFPRFLIKMQSWFNDIVSRETLLYQELYQEICQDLIALRDRKKSPVKKSPVKKSPVKKSPEPVPSASTSAAPATSMVVFAPIPQTE